MSQLRYHQSSFWGGEWSSEAQGQSDNKDYKTALKTALNMLPLEMGALRRRSGTQFVATARNNGLNIKLIPLSSTDGLTYVLELTNGIIRFHYQGHLAIDSTKTVSSVSGANPGVFTTSTNHGWSSGDRIIVDADGTAEDTALFRQQEFQVVSTGLDTFTLLYKGARSGAVDGADINWTTGTASRIKELASPYDEDEVPDVRYAQDESYLYLFHPAHATRIIDLTALTISVFSHQDGPYLDENTGSTTLTPSGTSGTVTLTASASLFASTDAGRLVRIKDAAGNWTWGDLVTYTSPTQFTWTIRGPNLSSTAARTTWRLGAFSDTTGWPSCGSLHEGRMWLGSSDYLARVDASATYLPTTFSPTSTDGTVPDNSGITAKMIATGRNFVRWFLSRLGGLAVGTEAGEWMIKASALDDPITPTSIQARRHAQFGSAEVQAVELMDRAYFAQALNTRLIELRSSDLSLRGNDASVNAHHITRSGIRELASSFVPFPVVWVLTDDGKLHGMTVKVDPDTNASTAGWFRLAFRGSADAEVTDTGNLYSIAVAPRSDRDLLDADTLWLATDRNGVSTIELLRPMFMLGDDETDTFFVDSGTRYNSDYLDLLFDYDVGSGDANFYGLYHLEGQTVDVVAFGADLGTATVTNGTVSVTIPSQLGVVSDLLTAGGSITVGLNMISRWQLLRPDIETTAGSSLGIKRRVDQVALLLEEASTAYVGMDFDDMLPFYFADPDGTTGVRPLFSGVHRGTVQATYDFDNPLAVEIRRPGPFTVLSVNGFIDMSTK